MLASCRASGFFAIGLESGVSDTSGFVYLLHFEKPLPDGRQHYVGFAQDRVKLEQRMASHREGTGGSFTRLMSERGIPFRAVRLWRGASGWADERRIKQRGARSMCPLCGHLTRRGRERGWYRLKGS